MRYQRIAFLLAAATGLWIACSSSKATAPLPTLVGTWQVASTPTFPVDSYIPRTFTITLAGGHGDTLALSMPTVHLFANSGALHWVFDSVVRRVLPQGDNVRLGIQKDTSLVYLVFEGHANTQRDTVMGPIELWAGAIDTLGRFVATKQ